MVFWAVVLILTVIACVVYALLRPFSKRVIFKSVSEVVGTIAIFAPIVAMTPFLLVAALLIYPLIGFMAAMFVYGMATALLRAVGLLAVVGGFWFWDWLPQWGWILGASLIMAALIYRVWNVRKQP